jgi:heat-inducible transcriptional repressor
MPVLNQRQEAVLNKVIQQYILTARSVGSRSIAKALNNKWSPATIRNIMSDLEDMKLLTHSHTSSGRKPTDSGYRYYVDRLSYYLAPSEKIQKLVADNISGLTTKKAADPESLLRTTSDALGIFSKQLGIALCPRFEEGIFHKLHLVELASNRLLMVLTIRSGLINTMSIEIDFEISHGELEKITSLINEKLSGLSIREIKKTLSDRLKLKESQDRIKINILRAFIENAEKLFNIHDINQLHISNTRQFLAQPEFESRDHMSSVIELLEEKNLLIHFLRQRKTREGVYVTIGGENEDGRFSKYSVITCNYSMGNVDGMLGIIGPKRMEYSNIVPLVDFTSKVVSETFSK